MNVYLAADGFVDELTSELRELHEIEPSEIHGRLILAPAARRPVIWAQNIWFDAVKMEFSSISDAAKKLRSMNGLWTYFAHDSFRRGILIEEQLPKFKSRPIDFLKQLKAPKINYPKPGAWALLAPNLLLASARTQSIYANGVVNFIEDKESAPSRAYLKLWDLFTTQEFYPVSGSRVLDMGSCPGGWTWVLQQLGCQVVSVDRADLDPKIAALPRVEFIRHSAFTLRPQDIGPVEWFFSDIICEPAKLLELVKAWRESGLCTNFVCTIKLKGVTDHLVTKEFLAIPGSRIVHLFHNKHELTWICHP